MNLDKLASLSHTVQTDLNSVFTGMIEPTIRAAISGMTLVQAGRLKAVGGTISTLEMANKTAMATKLVLNRYVSSVVAAIDMVVSAQQLRELDRDRLTAELTCEVLEPKIRAALKKYIDNIDFGETKGLLAEIVKQVRRIGADVIVDAVMEVMMANCRGDLPLFVGTPPTYYTGSDFGAGSGDIPPGDDPPPDDPPDTTAPTVVSVTPTDNATDVSVSTQVRAVFSEAMDPSTITTETFTLEQGTTPIPGVVAYSRNTAVFTPTNILSVEADVIARIKSGASDLAGNAMADDHEWTFTTAADQEDPPPTSITTLWLVGNPQAGWGGSKFTINGVETFLTGISYYGALVNGNEIAEIKEDIDWFISKGFNWMRVWPGWGHTQYGGSCWWDGQPIPDKMAKLKALVAYADEHGFVVDLTGAMCAPCYDNPCTTEPWRTVEQLMTFWTYMAVEFSAYRNWYADIGNEHDVGDVRHLTSFEVEYIAGRIRNLDKHRLLTCSGNNYWDAESERLDFTAPHLGRGVNAWQNTGPYLTQTLPLIVPRGVHLQEPFRIGYFGDNYTANDFCLDLNAAKTYGAMGWCFHTGAGFDMTQQRFRSQLDNEEAAFIEMVGSL